VVPLSSSAQVVIPDGPIEPLTYFGDTEGALPSQTRAAIRWQDQGVPIPELRDGDVVTTSGSPDGNLYQYLVPALETELLSSAELVQPTGMSQHPDTGEIWIADYGANRVVGFDPVSGVFRTIYDGPQLSGPWDVGFFWHGRAGNGIVYPEALAPGEPPIRAIISSRDNGRLIELTNSGGYAEYKSGSGIIEPTGIGEAWRFNDSTQIWEVFGYVAVADYAADRIIGYSGCASCRTFSFISSPLFDGPIDVAINLGSTTPHLILSRDSRKVIQAANFGPFGFGGVGPEVIVDGTNHFVDPVSISLMDPSPDPLNPHVHDYISWRARPSAGLFVVDQGADTIFRSALAGSTPTVFRDGLDSPTGMLLDLNTRDLFLTSADTGSGEASLIVERERYFAEFDGGSAADLYVGAMLGGRVVDDSWIIGATDAGASFTVPVVRDDEAYFYLGWSDPESAAPVTASFTQTLDQVLPKPTLALSSPVGGVLEAEVVHPVGALGAEPDRLALYVLTDCTELIDLAAAVYNVNGFGGRIPGEVFPFPNPVRDAHFSQALADDCLSFAGFFPADPSGTTTVTLDEVPWIPDTEQCMVALSIDDDDSIVSEFSDLNYIDACERPGNGGRNGIFCNQALPAESYDESSGFPLLPTAAGGTPGWFEYSVEGSGSEERQVVIWVDNEEAINALISVYDSCPSVEGSQLLAQGQQVVSLTARGGDRLRIRIVHFEKFPATWRMFDLSVGPTSEIAAPSNLVASTDESGRVTVCWDGLSHFVGLAMDEERLSYRIARGPVGGSPSEVLQENWRTTCFVDYGLAADSSWDYWITPRYDLKALDTQTQQIELLGERAGPVTGSTNGISVDLTPTLAAVTGLNVQLPVLIDGGASAGTQVWFDRDPVATSYRVVQTEANSLESESFILAGGSRAGEFPALDLPLGSYCYDVTPQWTSPEGDVVEGASAGWSEAGDTDYCVNLCEDATETVQITGDPLNRFSGPTVETVQFYGPVRYYELDTQGRLGQVFSSNESGQPAEVCAWTGSSLCNDLVFEGCVISNEYGNAFLNLFLAEVVDKLIFRWRYLPPETMSPRQQQAITFPIQFGFGVATASTNPEIAMTVIGQQCATELTLDYLISNWATGPDGYASILSDGAEAASITELSGTLPVPLDPSRVLHEITVQLFNNPLELEFSRTLLVPADRILGDVNFDCSLDVLDGVRLINHILGRVSFVDGILPVADMSQDSEVNILDLVELVTTILTEAEATE